MEKHTRKLLLFFSILVGLCSSTVWIYPLFLDAQANHKLGYLPVRRVLRAAASSIADDYFYYAYVQENLSKTFFSQDPTTFEGKYTERIPGHVVYTLSLLAGSIGGMLTSKLDHAYYFNHFFYPALTVFSVGTMASYLTGSVYPALLILIVAARNMTEMGRMPHPMVTAIAMMLLVLLCYRILKANGSLEKKSFFIPLLAGLSPLMSVANFFCAFTLVGLTWLFLFFTKKKWKPTLKLLFASAMFALPFIILLFIKRPIFNEIFEEFAMRPIEIMTSFYWSDLINACKFEVFALLVCLLFRFQNQAFCSLMLLSILVAYSALSFFHGTYYGSYVIRENLPIIFSVSFSAFYLIVKRILTDGKVEFSFSKPISVIPKAFRLKNTTILHSFLCIILIGYTSLYARGLVKYWITTTEGYSPKRFDPELRGLIDWAATNTKAGDVLNTTNFDLVLNLLPYAPIDMYIPQALLSPLPKANIQQRLFETLSFWGVTPEALKSYLLTPPNEMRLFFKFVITYGRYPVADFPEDYKSNLVENYRSFQTPKNLSFRATHLAVTTEDLFPVDINSPAFKITQSLPVFENAKYKIFKIQ